MQMKFTAFILMNVNLGCETAVLNTLKRTPGFVKVFYVFGDYDIVAKVSANSPDELNQIVSQVRKLANIKSTTTMIVREL